MLSKIIIIFISLMLYANIANASGSMYPRKHQPIPEPITLISFGIGMVGVYISGKKKR